MDEFIEVGKITKPQGLKGELKVQSINEDIGRFLGYSYIYVGDEKNKFAILKSRTQNNFVYLFLENINSIEDAEKLKNQLIFIDKTQLPALEKDEYYVRDLLDCKVLLQGQELGKIIDISDYSSVSTITIKSPNGEIMFPFLNAVINNIDIDSKVVELNEEEFEKVRLDEN